MDCLLRAREADCAPRAALLYDWRPPLFSPSRIEALRDAVGLSVEELYSLPAPASQAAVQQNAFASLVTMGFAKADQELLNVFGRARPSADLMPREAALADEYEAYLRDIFMNGYGCWSLSDMDDSYVRDLFDSVDRWRERLDYYLNGYDDPSCLGGSPDYGALMRLLTQMHYETCVPLLPRYGNDGAQAWAAELHAYASARGNSDSMTLFARTREAALGEPKHMANMMDILDDAPHVQREEGLVTYGADYGHRAANAQMTRMAASFSGIPAEMLQGSGAQLDGLLVSLAEDLRDAAFDGAPFRGQVLPEEVAADIREELEAVAWEDWLAAVLESTRSGLMLIESNTDAWLQ